MTPPDLRQTLASALSDEVLEECFGYGEIRPSDVRSRLVHVLTSAIAPSALEAKARAWDRLVASAVNDDTRTFYQRVLDTPTAPPSREDTRP